MHGSGHDLSQHARWHACTAFKQACTADKARPIWVRGADFTPLQMVAGDAVVADLLTTQQASG